MKTRLPVFAALLLTYAPLRAQEKPDAPATPANAAIERTRTKLDHIIIPRLRFTEAAFADTMEFLNQRSAELDVAEPDPAHRGVVIVGKMEAPRITLALSNLPLLEVLHYVAAEAGAKAEIGADGRIILLPLSAKPDSDARPLEFMPPEDPAKVEISLTVKIDHLIIPKLAFREASLEDAIEFLRRQSVNLDTTEMDPGRKGINFGII